MRFGIRPAIFEDIEPLCDLIHTSARELAREHYTSEQIEKALHGAWGVDSQLIRDGTYFVVENGGMLVGCGGWSRRKTMFGSDAHSGREPVLLDSMTEAARIRAFFVHPKFARQGIGRLLLNHCEMEAKRQGFSSAELVATLPGVRFYLACGYEVTGRNEYKLCDNVTIEFAAMRKPSL